MSSVTAESRVSHPIIVYDDHCTLCSRLAHWSEVRLDGKVRFEPWSSYCSRLENNPEANSLDSPCREGRREQLLYIDGNTLKTGTQAWEFLLQNHPSLRELRWLAQKLGFEPQIAAHLGRAAGWLKSAWCRSCPKLPLR